LVIAIPLTTLKTLEQIKMGIAMDLRRTTPTIGGSGIIGFEDIMAGLGAAVAGMMGQKLPLLVVESEIDVIIVDR
jgi:hypothetical protein